MPSGGWDTFCDNHCSALHEAGLGHLVPSVGRAITERVRSRGCSQIDKWLHHPLLHESPIIFAGVSQAPSGVTNPRAAMDHASHEASTRLQRRHTARAWSDFILGLLVASAQIANSWRDLTLSLLANANHAQTWRNAQAPSVDV